MSRISKAAEVHRRCQWVFRRQGILHTPKIKNPYTSRLAIGKANTLDYHGRSIVDEMLYSNGYVPKGWNQRRLHPATTGVKVTSLKGVYCSIILVRRISRISSSLHLRRSCKRYSPTRRSPTMQPKCLLQNVSMYPEYKHVCSYFSTHGYYEYILYHEMHLIREQQAGWETKIYSFFLQIHYGKARRGENHSLLVTGRVVVDRNTYHCSAESTTRCCVKSLFLSRYLVYFHWEWFEIDLANLSSLDGGCLVGSRLRVTVCKEPLSHNFWCSCANMIWEGLPLDIQPLSGLNIPVCDPVCQKKSAFSEFISIETDSL